MKVAFLEIDTQNGKLKASLKSAFQRVMGSGCFIGGLEVEAFERATEQSDDITLFAIKYKP